jgi:hypothetical protein
VASLIRRVVPTQSRADTVGWLIAWSLLLWCAVLFGRAVFHQVSLNWWPAYDTYAYELAARHILNGKPLYAPSSISAYGAFKYPPVFAQVVVFIGLLPDRPVDWAWRFFSLLCLRYMCGSWKLTLVATTQIYFMKELGYGNVTMELGAVALWSFRDKRAIYLLPWLAGMKFGPALLLPYLWVTRPNTRRTIVIACAVFAAACLASFAIAPHLWWDYLGTFGWETSSAMHAEYVRAFLPNSGGLDFAIRFALGAALMVVAIRWRLNWLAFIAATVTMPIFSLTRLVVLAALWPLWLRGMIDRWRQTDGLWQRWLTAPLVHLDMLPPLSAGTASSAGETAA